MLVNLFGNAIKFTERARSFVTAKVEPAERRRAITMLASLCAIPASAFRPTGSIGCSNSF